MRSLSDVRIDVDATIIGGCFPLAVNALHRRVTCIHLFLAFIASTARAALSTQARPQQAGMIVTPAGICRIQARYVAHTRSRTYESRTSTVQVTLLLYSTDADRNINENIGYSTVVSTVLQNPIVALRSYYINLRLTDCICLFVRSGAYVRYFRGSEGRRRRLQYEYEYGS